MLLLKVKTFDNHRVITPGFLWMLFVSSLTFYGSFWLYSDGHYHESKTILWSEMHVFSDDVLILFRSTGVSNRQHPREYCECRQYFTQWNLFEDGERGLYFQLLFHKISVPGIHLGLFQACPLWNLCFQRVISLHLREM